MMKQHKSLHICFFLLTLTFLGGCTKEMDGPEEGRPSDQICFSTSLEALNVSVSTKAQGEHLMMESEDWVLEPATRVAPTTSLSGTAGVIAYKDAATSPVSELSDESFTFDAEMLSPSGSPIPWSKASGASTLHVFSYAPYDAVHADSPAATINTATASPTLTYTVPNSVGVQMDLIAASADVASESFGSSIPLTFDHVLTAVRFKVDFACKVKSLTVNGVYKSGTYTIGGDWSGQSTTQSYTFSNDLFGASGTDYAADAFLIDGSNTLMLMPQTVPAGATVVLTYDDDQTLTASIADHEWIPGKRVTYTISKTGISYIYFDLTAGNVSIVDNTYTGYVYQNDGESAYTVTGTHLATNRYYVYQSSTVSGSPGYYTNTGYSGAGGEGLVRVPEYAEMRHSGLSWNKYITNNLDHDGIIDAWKEEANNVKRDSTNNTIQIYCSGPTYKSDMDVDITIDNLWSSFFSNASHRVVGGILIGPGGEPRTANRNNRYERVTLRLKGDNRFCNVLYWGHPTKQGASDRGFFKVTSYEGDGSPNGSITTLLPGKGIAMTGGTTLFGSGDNDECNPCNDMYINGGTFYAATPRPTGAGARGVFGGGSNNHCDMVFNGGVVTAIAYDTAAAIGGGGGSDGNGGDAKITINGGTLYAYQFGNLTSSTAIGGGSSRGSTGNSAEIIINGGEIYAQSTGGVAIGGGSSESSDGGTTSITITGGTIIARSIAGTRGDGVGVTASTGIGGGTGGYSGNGGSASLTISGGKLYTGSIGGGKTISSSPSRSIGSASVNISGTALMQGQFIMAAGAATAPTFTMSGGTINNSDLSESYGFYKIKEDGGSVYIGGGTNPGTFTMTGGTIINSNADLGGAVYQEGGEVSITGGIINSCSADEGGALYVSAGTVSISGGTLQNCTASGAGGAVYISGGTASISGSASIDRCISTDEGGALFVTGGNVTLSNGTISNNRSSTASGGGIFVNNGSFSMSAGTLSGNHAATNGGGVAVSSVDSDVTVNITGGNITENSCGENGGGLSVVPAGGHAATVNLGVINQGLTNPNISGNNATRKGGGVYASGSDAAIVINSGKIIDNTVYTLVANPDVANDGGLVTLNAGDVTHVVVTYHMNDGANPEVTATQLIVTAVRSILSAPSWSLSGHTFGGWYTNPAGTGDSYANGDEVNLTTGLHLYAKWNPVP